MTPDANLKFDCYLDQDHDLFLKLPFLRGYRCYPKGNLTGYGSAENFVQAMQGKIRGDEIDAQRLRKLVEFAMNGGDVIKDVEAPIVPTDRIPQE